ncbi:hypothetical protein [Senegalia massiliensis]|uniref:Uncharacterized protein n=1 Tax=Senegalia massiliensis TaxID=1720316 RepID=A0A845R236_9CLOT|nr:hypothetical protein [Senegalia massiliensis]NBI07608.1 hypothetical protein [Senegalia massiliensis]
MNKETTVEEFSKLISNIPFKNIDLKEIYINTNEDFILYRHQILNGYYIAIYNDGNNHLRVITENKNAFIINLENVDKDNYSILYKVHKPRKIVLDAKPIYKNDFNLVNGIYDILLISNIFYKLHINDINDFIKTFMNNVDSNNINTLIYNLHIIKDKFNTILDKNKMFTMVNKEFELLEVISRCELNGLPCNCIEFEKFINVMNEKFKENESTFSEVYKARYTNLKSLLNGLKQEGHKPVFNEEYLYKTGNTTLYSLSVVRRIYKENKNRKINSKSDRILPTYNPYNKIGAIESNFNIDPLYLPYLTTDKEKYYITSKYENLELRIFANLSNIDYLIEWSNNNNLIPSMAEKLFKEQYNEDKQLYELYTYALLKALIKGYNSLNSIRKYFISEVQFLLNEEEIKEYLKKFKEEFKEVIIFIYNFNKTISHENRVSTSSAMPIYKYMKLTSSDIMKDFIIKVYKNIKQYNKRNKYKLSIVYLSQDKIIIESDKESYNLALDILNRNLSKAYNKYVKNVSMLSSVNTGFKRLRA